MPAALISIICALTLTNWGAIAAIVAAIVVVVSTGYGICKWVKCNNFKKRVFGYIQEAENELKSEQSDVSIWQIFFNDWSIKADKDIKNNVGKYEASEFMKETGFENMKPSDKNNIPYIKMILNMRIGYLKGLLR